MADRLAPPRNKEDRFGDETPVVIVENNEVRHYNEKEGLLHYDFLGRYHFWIFLSIALIFGLIVWMLYQSNSSVLSSASGKFQAFLNPSVLAILILIALVVVSYAAFQADLYCGNFGQELASNTFFLIFLFLFLAWGYLLFTTSLHQYAFWAAIALLVISIIWFFWLWKVDRLSSYFMIYVVLLLVYLSYFTNQLQKASTTA